MVVVDTEVADTVVADMEVVDTEVVDTGVVDTVVVERGKKENSFFTTLACENVVMMEDHFLSLSREKNAQQIYQTARA